MAEAGKPVNYKTIVVGPLQVNCYVVWDENTRKAAIIDPGGSRQDIVDTCAAENLEVHYILLTHGHFDHSFHAGDLREYYDAKIAMHPLDVEVVTSSLEVGAMFYPVHEFVAFSADIELGDGEEILLGDEKIQALHSPGHTPGGLMFVTGEGVFCGDTVFAGSVGRTDFPGGDYDALQNTIKERVLTLSDDTKLMPGHGPDTTVGKEKATNPFFPR